MNRRDFLRATAGILVSSAAGVERGLSTESQGDLIPPKYAQAINQRLKWVDEMVGRGPFLADWRSLYLVNEAPDWFRDAKFGIYFHWGVYSVPAFDNEWYPRNMHIKTHRVYKHHVEKYGDPAEFPYHRFVPMWKAERFDPEGWAELFVEAGARFAGPVCEHHDGFSLWKSEVNPWNAFEMGPKRDITGELCQAIRRRGLRFITTFHHAPRRTWYPRVEGWATTSTDPLLRIMYANLPSDILDRLWLAKLAEVIGQYQPDIIWFDFGLKNVAEPYHLKFLASYYNAAATWGREVVVTTKNKDYPAEVCVEDFEKGRLDRLTDYAWLTDDTISTGSWCYTQDLKIKPARRVLHDLIDIVSKNGCLLLNISPMAEGVIPDDQKAVLYELGRWLRINGEAIYNTRPWLTFGEGPTRLQKEGHFVQQVEYTAKDIRYTRSKDGQNLYAILLGWPQERELTLQSILVHESNGATVELLGYDRQLPFRVSTDRQLIVTLPDVDPAKLPSKYAFVLKIRNLKCGLHPNIARQVAEDTARRLESNK